MMKKFIPLFALIVMIFGLSMGVSAADDYQVIIYLQEADRSVSPVDVDVLTDNPVVVYVDAGDTLQDAIEEAIPSAVWNGEYLVELTYDSSTYTDSTVELTDISVPPEDPWTHYFLAGTYWYWFQGEPDDMPSSLQGYPGGLYYALFKVLGESPRWYYPEITDDIVVTLSFESVFISY